MELTVDQMLQQSIAAHNQGNLQEAERLYQAILQVQPKHPDANHNLGILAVSVNQPGLALPLFETAIDVNPNIEQFWLSYIGALIKLSRLEDATKTLEKSMNVGHRSENIAQLGGWLAGAASKKSVVVKVEEFYQKIKETILSPAAAGWQFTDSFERYFMENNAANLGDSRETYASRGGNASFRNRTTRKKLNPRQIINVLNNEANITKKFNLLRELISSNNVNLVNGSFTNSVGSDLGHAQKKTFDAENLNIVIIGAGVCGLFLANSIKYCFGDLANVLLLDNRSKKNNTRERFTRNWLTHVPVSFFQNHTPPNVRSLIESFGTIGLIGVPINALEAILMLSCKTQGVKFYFSPRIECALLDNNIVDLVFDATGGRLVECEYPDLNSTTQNIEIPNKIIDLKHAAVNQLYNFPDGEAGNILVELKPHGNFHYPHIGNNKICTHMVKLTGIPENLIKSVRSIAEPRNSLNLFYIWNGALKKEINEGLVFINLIDKEYSFLQAVIDKPMKLKYFLNESPGIQKKLNENIIFMLETLVTLDKHSQITIEKPFNYAPYVNLNAGTGTLDGKSIFPVGDSLFCGHPKVGNGLATHLKTINELVGGMV